jgi:molybdopterin converting factor small subunit
MPTVNLYANLRKLAGTKELSIAPPSGMLRPASRGSTLGEVLSELVRRNPALDGVILASGEIRPHFVITINGQITTDLNASVTEQDVLAIFPPIAGGASPPISFALSGAPAETKR